MVQHTPVRADVPAPDIRFAVAVRATGSLWQAGSWLRAVLLAAAWSLLAWSQSAPDAVRGGLQLLPCTVGLALAFAHRRPETLARLDMNRYGHRLAEHLTSTLHRVRLNAAGLAEGFGCVLMAWIFVGPIPLRQLPPAARVAGVCLAACYIWDVMLQSVTDPAWYSRSHPPPRPVRRVRWIIPLGLAVVEFLAFGPLSVQARFVPAPVRYELAVTPLLLYPVWAWYEVVLNAAAEHLRGSELLWRADLASDLHSAVKNPLSLLQRQLTDSMPSLEESRSLVREARIAVEGLRQQLQVPQDVLHPVIKPFGDLWDTVHRTLPAVARPRCRLRAGAAEVPLHHLDRLLMERTLADLLTNALVHGCGTVETDLSIEALADGVRAVCLEVVCPELVDAGPVDQLRAGGSAGPGDLVDRRSSLAQLRERVRRFGGDLVVTSGSQHRVRAWWPVHPHDVIGWSDDQAPPAAPTDDARGHREVTDADRRGG
jgi:hypothetical protein